MQSLSAFGAKYPVLSSAIHTFLATFIVTLLGSLSVIPESNILSASTWTTAFVGGALAAAVRTGIKAVSPLSA